MRTKTLRVAHRYQDYLSDYLPNPTGTLFHIFGNEAMNKFLHNTGKIIFLREAGLRIRDPVPYLFDPSGMGKNQNPDPG